VLDGETVVRHYGAPDRERAAMRAGAAFVLIPWRKVFAVEGPDRVRFLHGVLTQDVQGLAPGAWAPATACTRQGKLIAAFDLLACEDAFWLDTDAAAFEPALAALARYVVMDRVTIHNVSSEYVEIGVWGPDAETAVRAVWGDSPAPYRFLRSGDALIRSDGSLDLPGFVAWLPWAAAEETGERLLGAGARPCGFEVWEEERIRAGTPRWGADVSADLLPVEAGLDAAVSYTKGCYVGQEVLLRLRNFSEPVRRLVRLSVECDAVLARGTVLRAGGAEVGRVTSAIAGCALGLVRKPHYAAGTRLDAGGAGVEVAGLAVSGRAAAVSPA
jgi:aminomethyltransferase